MKHEVKVVRLGEIHKHPDADSLGLTEIDGFTVVVRLSDWSAGDVGVYIEPDYVVPVAPWSEFLGSDERKRRIKVKRLRGIYSQGLLLPLKSLPLDPSTEPGTDVMEALGIQRWEPPDDGGPGIPRNRNPGETPHPSLASLSKYDLESAQKYGRVIEPDTLVVVTEKIHGENARYAWAGDRLWVGSRNRWVSEAEWGGHWQTVKDNPWILDWCRSNPGRVLYGESFGNNPGMRYGIEPGRRGFLAFDVFDCAKGRFWNEDEVRLSICRDDRLVPVLFRGAYGECDLAELAEGKSTLADHVREGCVVKPVVEAFNPRIGRVALKRVGNGYYEKADK